MAFLVIALFIVLVLLTLFVIGYISVSAVFKIVNTVTRAFSDAPVGATGILPPSIKKSLREARNYASMIRKTADQYPAGPLQDRLNSTVKPVDEWLANLDKLELALRRFYAQRNIPREIRHVTFEIEQLHRQLLSAPSNELASIKALIDSKQKHRDTLQELQSFQNQAELRIRKIASDLGAAHAEMLLITAKGKFSDSRLQRLDENLQDQVTGLRDMISAMDDIGYSRAAY